MFTIRRKVNDNKPGWMTKAASLNTLMANLRTALCVSPHQAGNIILGKLTFYSLDKDKVRQHGEESTDDGKT